METKQSNVSELTESLNILPQMNDSEVKYYIFVGEFFY